MNLNSLFFFYFVSLFLWFCATLACSNFNQKAETTRRKLNTCLLFVIRSRITPNHCTAQLVRLLLFRECEVRGRRLLFDSSGGGGQQQQTAKEEFQEIQLMKDMVFGSATLKYSGENYRLHDFTTSPWKGSNLNISIFSREK